MAQYDREDLEAVHPDYKKQVDSWEFYTRSYFGGNEYKYGSLLHKYSLETDTEYDMRISSTPLDNHCKNVIETYSSFLFRKPPRRDLGSFTDDPSIEHITKDADLDGRSFDTLMKDASEFANIYGHCFLMVDKPKTLVGTRGEELEKDIRPYISLITAENITDWHYTRLPNGKYILDKLIVREDVTKDGTLYKVWYLDQVDTVYLEEKGEAKLIDSQPNPLGRIPAVILYSQRSPKRGIGLSLLQDIAELQQAIYNELSEIEQLIRLSNHPSLVKTPGVEASAGAGSIVLMPEETPPELKPYQLQPSGANLDSVRESIKDKVEAINRISHLGAVRTLRQQPSSGVALRTEFNLLNSRLTSQAELLQLAEEQIWDLIALWQGKVFDGEINYSESYDIRDYSADMDFYLKTQTANVPSKSFKKELDRKIVQTVIDDEEILNEINNEIDTQPDEPLGQFSPEPAEEPEVIEEE